jgi:hypothetical protein
LHDDFGYLKSANWRQIYVWEGMTPIQILLGDEATLSQIPVLGTWHLKLIGVGRHLAALLKFV